MLRWGDWMGQAEEEYATAEWLLQGERFAWCCFTCEQAAEKALKAVLEARSEPHLGHHLPGLLESIAADPPAPRALRAACRRLGRHYIPTRYPDAHPSGVPAEQYGPEDAAQALEDARAVLDFARRHLPTPPAEPGGVPG